MRPPLQDGDRFDGAAHRLWRVGTAASPQCPIPRDSRPCISRAERSHLAAEYRQSKRQQLGRAPSQRDARLPWTKSRPKEPAFIASR